MGEDLATWHPSRRGFVRRAWPAVALLSVLAACLAACGPQGSVPPGTPTVPTIPAAATATLVVATQPVRFATADGATLEGSLYGHGSLAVILSNEGDNASGPWQPVAQQMAAHGYLVLSYAYRPSGPNYEGLAAHAVADLGAAIAFMRAHAITRLILIGASLGALVSLKVATTADCDGLIAISSPLGYQDVQLADAELAGLAMPKLFVTSQDNQPFAADTLHMFDVSPQPKDKRVYPGSAHGTSLFTGSSGADLESAMLAFVMRYAPPR